MATNHNGRGVGCDIAFIERARMIDGLDVDYALSLMQGSVELFKKSLNLAGRMILATIDRVQESA